MKPEDIYREIVRILSESFELDAGEIKLETKLYEDLGLDSIDAVDIFVQLREITGRRPNPEVAKKIRTVEELVGFVEDELKAKAEGVPEPDVPMP